MINLVFRVNGMTAVFRCLSFSVEFVVFLMLIDLIAVLYLFELP